MRGNGRKVTMTEVARQAGVALSTVSHVLNNTAPISEDTKKRVLKVVEELNYTPNGLAQGLRYNRTDSISIIVPDIANEFYARFGAGIVKLAGEEKITASIIDIGYSLEREKNSVESLIRKRTDGIVMIGGSHDESLIERISGAGIPLVFGDRRYEDFPSVEFDNYATMYDLIMELFKNGYTKIGYISEAMTMVNLKDRYRGVTDALKKCGLRMEGKWVLDDSWLRLEKLDTARELIKKLLGELETVPEVFIASSDLIAIGVMDGLRQLGYRIPEDLGVIGYDNQILSRYYNPSLTTVFQDHQRAAMETYRLLKDKMEGKEKNEHVTLHNKIVKRQSVRLETC